MKRYLLLSHIDHQHLLLTVNNQLAGEDSPNWARPDNKDICLVDFVLFPQEIYLHLELLFWRQRDTLAWLSRKRGWFGAGHVKESCALFDVIVACR